MLIDFGCALFIDDPIKNKPHENRISGTLFYAAPEQMFFHEEIRFRTPTESRTEADMWACGMILATMLHGGLPNYVPGTDITFKLRK